MLRCLLGINLRTLFLKQVPVFASLLPKLEREFTALKFWGVNKAIVSLCDSSSLVEQILVT